METQKLKEIVIKEHIMNNKPVRVLVKEYNKEYNISKSTIYKWLKGNDNVASSSYVDVSENYQAYINEKQPGALLIISDNYQIKFNLNNLSFVLETIDDVKNRRHS